MKLADVNCSFISSRVTAIVTGTITTLLWLPYPYIIAMDMASAAKFSGRVNEPLVAIVICFFMNSVMSALMVYGVIKKNPNHMFPWLAIHFVGLMACLSVAFLRVLYSIFNDSIQPFLIWLTLFLLIASTLIYLWYGVYTFYQRLYTEKPAEATCLTEDKGLKMQNETLKPYHPV